MHAASFRFQPSRCRIIAILTAIALFPGLSCKKNLDTPSQPPSMEELQVPENFTWGTSAWYTIEVSVTGDGEGKTLQLYRKNGDLLNAGTIIDNKIVFSFQVENDVDTVRIYSPTTRISQYLLKDAGHATFAMEGGLKSAPLTLNNYAAGFNGSNQYILVNNGASGAIVVQYPFTFSAWFKTPGNNTENDDMALVNIADPNYATVYHGLYLRKYQDNFYKAGVKSKNKTLEYVKSTNQNVSDDTWHQVVGAFTADGKRKLYLDGIYEGMSTSVLPYNTDNVLVTFGRWGDNTPDNYFYGMMDNICIWNRELSADEVSTYYNNQPVGNETGLVGYWQFNEGTGTATVNTASPGGYPATLSGATWINLNTNPDSDGDGVPDASDDWPLDPTKAYNSIFPSGNNYYFHMFEDLWPGLGDYDFNDVILKTKLHIYKNAQNNIVGGRVISSVYWIGGNIPRGAGMEWFRSNGPATQLTYLPAGTVTFSEPEHVLTDPLVENAVTLFNGTITESRNDTVDFEYTWDAAVAGNNLWVQVYIYCDRDHEIHMLGHPPTKAADMALFQTAQDASQTTWTWTPGTTFSIPAPFYKTETNLPWGLEIITDELYIPDEKTEILIAYPQFQAWAESGGTVNPSWYRNPDPAHAHLP